MKHTTIFTGAWNYTDTSFQVRKLGGIKAVPLPDRRTVAHKPTRGCTLCTVHHGPEFCLQTLSQFGNCYTGITTQSNKVLQMLYTDQKKKTFPCL